jgi:hypothetical protein
VARCKLCGAPHSSCGPATTVVPIDHNVTKKGDAMTLNRYETTVNGNHTTLLLSDEDAKRMGLKPAGKAEPTNKAARPAATKGAAPTKPATK